jgi:hypothetical protein
MAAVDLGANQFVFIGYGLRITYLTEAPGPVHPGDEGGVLQYHDTDGDRVFRGREIGLQDSPLGTLLTITLRPNADLGALKATVLVPHLTGVAPQHSVDFDTVLVKTASRGFWLAPGSDLTYTIDHLRGTGSQVMLPKAQESAGSQTPSTPS